MKTAIREATRNHHAYLKEELPEIERLTHTIFRVHYEDSGDFLEIVYRLFGKLKTLLEIHIINEERSLFYQIIDYQEKPSDELLEEIKKGIEEIESDFDIAEEIFREIRKTTNNYVVPPSSCQTFDKTYKKLEDLEAEFSKHKDLEMDQIFKPFKS